MSNDAIMKGEAFMNKKKKRIVFISVGAVLLCACIAALLSYPVSIGKRMEIRKAWSSYAGARVVGFDWDRRNICGMRYYCTENGYDILLSPGALQMLSTEVIGDVEVTYKTAFSIYAYKDGTLQPLKSIYETGEITHQQLEKIAEIHKSING